MELKKCPFCGASAKVVTTREVFNECVKGHGSACVSIACQNHDCGTTMYCYYPTEDYDVKVAVATDRWNRRQGNV